VPIDGETNGKRENDQEKKEEFEGTKGGKKDGQEMVKSGSLIHCWKSQNIARGEKKLSSVRIADKKTHRMKRDIRQRRNFFPQRAIDR